MFIPLMRNKYMNKLFEILCWFKEKSSMKAVMLFFVFIMIPNILRQVIYYVTFLKTGSVDFIVSFETVAIYKTFPFIGVIEEFGFGLIYTFFWFNFRRLRFFAYGWITDALFDFVSVIVWVFFGMTPLQMLGLGAVARFVLREMVLFYFMIGPLLYLWKVDIKKLSLVYSGIGVLFLVLILLF